MWKGTTTCTSRYLGESPLQGAQQAPHREGRLFNPGLWIGRDPASGEHLLKGDGAFGPTFFFMLTQLQIINRQSTSAQVASSTSPDVQEEGMERQAQNTHDTVLVE